MLKSILAYIDSAFTFPPRAASAEAVDYAVRETFDKLVSYPVLQLGFEDNELMVARQNELDGLDSTPRVWQDAGVHHVVAGWYVHERTALDKAARQARSLNYKLSVHTENYMVYMDKMIKSQVRFAIIVANWFVQPERVFKLYQGFIDTFLKLTVNGSVLVISKHLLPPLEELKFDGFERLDDKGDFVLFKRLPDAPPANPI